MSIAADEKLLAAQHFVFDPSAAALARFIRGEASLSDQSFQLMFLDLLHQILRAARNRAHETKVRQPIAGEILQERFAKLQRQVSDVAPVMIDNVEREIEEPRPIRARFSQVLQRLK